MVDVPSRHADAPPITIRHLITHTSGLPREAAFPSGRRASFRAGAAPGGPGPSGGGAATETRWKYSNLALALAGEVVAAASGEPYADYVAAHVLRPLGMASTLVTSPDPADPRLARGFGRRLPDGRRAAAPFTDSRGITAAANMTTSVSDLARFAMLQFRGGPRRRPGLARQHAARDAPRALARARLERRLGIGLSRHAIGSKTFIGHGGSVRVPDAAAICPSDKLGSSRHERR